MGKQKKKREISAAERQRRTEQASARKAMNDNNMWDGCETLYKECAGLLTTTETLQAVIAIPGLIAELQDPVVFEENLDLFIKDSRDLSGRLAALHEQHAGQTGSAKDKNEFVKALAIHEQYVQFMEVWRLTIQPVWNVLMEHTGVAELALMNKKTELAKAQAQDPNHTDPIDVEATDIQVQRGQTSAVTPVDELGVLPQEQSAA